MPSSLDRSSDLTPQYATTQSKAEEASSRPAKSFATLHTVSGAEPVPGGDVGGRVTVSKPDGTEDDKPRPDAKIWSLYLTEAKEEAKQQAELWKTDLESLLLFAGLFAGVVASFVVDSRHDLQPQTKAEVLLADIRNALRNETNSRDTLKPDAPALWTNGLWFASLLITLFSATMGILAKSWVVKFIPVAGGQEADDAYQQWFRDERAKLWYLGTSITILPGLIHFALLLFSIGFGLQSVGDNSKLGWMVLGLVFLGTIIYLVITVAPFFFPGIPCQTPLFLVLDGFARLCRPATSIPEDDDQIDGSWSCAPKRKDVLSRIWREQLAQSAKPSNVDEAIAELTQKKLNDDWWKIFVKWKTPEILRRRLQESITDGFQHDSYEVLRDRLHALSGFVDYFKKNSDYENLKTKLGGFLEPGNPLHRWNVFPEKIRALAFSVRAPILLACKKDYTTSEMEELPWEMMVHDMLPGHRRNFAMAACRGLVGDQERLRKVSALSIVVCIAKDTVAAIGPKSEWGVEIDGEAINETKLLGRQYLAKLFEEIAKGWKTSVLENLNKTLSVAVNSDSRDITMLGGLGWGLKQLNPKVRTRAITTLVTLAADADFGAAVQSSIPELAEMAVNDPDRDVRVNGIGALILLARNEKFQDTTKQVFPDSLKAALNTFEWVRRVRAIDDIVILLRRPDFQAEFQDAVGPLISDFIELAVGDWDEDVRAAGTKAVRSLLQDEKLRGNVKLELPERLKLGFQSLSWPRIDALGRLVTLIQDFGLEDAVNPGISQLAGMVMSEGNPDIRITGMKMLASLAQDNVLRDTIIPELPKILGIAWSDIPSLAYASWIELLLWLSDQTVYQDSIKLAIPSLLKMTMNGTDTDTHTAGVKALASLVEDESLQGSIKLQLPSNLESALMEPDWEARICTINTLVMLVKELNLQDVTEAAVPELIRMVLNDEDNDVRAAGMKSLVTLVRDVDSISLSLPVKLESAFKKSDPWNRVYVIDTLGRNSDFRDAVQLAIPKLVEMAVNDEGVHVQEAGMKAVASLAQDGKFHDIIGPTASNILGSASKDFHWRVRVVWFEILVILAQNSGFQPFVESALPKFVEIAIEDKNEDVRAAAMKSLASLAQSNKFRSIVKPGLTEMINSTRGDPSWEVRAAWAEIHVTLAQIPDFQACVESGIPELLEIVTKDDVAYARVAGLKSLVALAQDDNLRATSTIVRGTIKSALPKSLDSAFKDLDWRVRIVWTEALVTLAQSPDFRDNLQLAIPKLIKIAVGDDDNDVRKAGVEALTFLVKDKKLQDTVISALPKSLDSVFEDSDLRVSWSGILETLIRRDLRLGGVTESAIPEIVEITIQVDDEVVRTTMVKLLSAFSTKDDTKIRDATGSALSKSLDSALRNPDWELRFHAIKMLRALVPNPNFQDAVKSGIPQLLKMAVNDEDEDVRASGVELLKSLQTDHANKANIGDAILLAVPFAIPLVTQEGDDIRRAIGSLMHFAGAPTDPEPTAKSMAHALTSRLNGSLWLTRATAVEFLAVLNKYTTFRQFIQSAIPEIIRLALEDKEDDVRAAGIRSLVNLAEEGAFRDKIKAILPQLMPLLEVNRLRAPVTELISLLAVDEIVRKDVISCIINPLTKKAAVYPDGLLELLSRLIIDKRFGCEQAPDQVVLSVASVLLMQPQTANFRFQTATALWCNYGDTYTSPQHAEFHEHLVELFLFTLFGRHVTLDEVNTWRSMASHLPPPQNKELIPR